MIRGGGEEMPILVIGGTGFIGSRVTRRLAIRGEEVVCMDINPGAASFADLGDKVKVVRGDVTQFDDVMRVMVETQPTRVINLSYLPGSDHAPHVAMRLNVLGMDNCFGAPGKARRFQRVQFPPRQGPSQPTGNRFLGSWW
jgi:nucleoside-diphosphate-sugar epimerase